MDSERTCGRCGDQVAYLSTDNLCDGCVAEQEAAEAERDLRLRGFHAEAVKDPGYQEALEAARGPVSASKGMFLEDALRAEAEALLDMDGRRERLEQLAADLQSGKIQPLDHATATARMRQSIAEGEQAMADQRPMTTIDDLSEQDPRQSTAYLIGKDGGTFKFTITDIEPDDQS